VAGVFRSDNGGTGWVRINDDAHRYGNAGEALAGDPRVYGRVYLGTNGRGILYADRTGGSTPPPVTPSASASASPPPVTPSTPPPVSPSASASATPPPAATGCTATYKITGSWGGGFQGEVTVRNTGTAPTKTWSVGWTFGNGQVVSQVWGGTGGQTGTAVTVRDAGWNGVLAANATTTFGFLASTTGTNPLPSPITCAATS
jgi:xyloglucan-specific exo-beta-1,4-glucanase